MKAPDSISNAFPRRPEQSHKHSIGTVAVVGGSNRFAHAPVICALGARAAGAGLIQLTVPDASRIAAASLVPEATFVEFAAACEPTKADVTAVGMGLGVSSASGQIVSGLLDGRCGRFVVDADALTILASRYAAKPGGIPPADGRQLVLTPHSGEAARLLSCTSADIQRDREASARLIATRYRAICVLKGAHTIVAGPEGRIFTCESGNPFMAMGGMGDLLSGVIAARWAYIKDAYLAACSAVWLHSAASDAIVGADTPGDPSIVNTAAMIGSLRVSLERQT